MACPVLCSGGRAWRWINSGLGQKKDVFSLTMSQMSATCGLMRVAWWTRVEVGLCLSPPGEGSVVKWRAASPSGRSRKIRRSVLFPWETTERAGEKQRVRHHGAFPGGWWVDMVS